MAGFREKGGSFFFPRAGVEPDDWLAKMEEFH
jgi:hypothetical protein